MTRNGRAPATNERQSFTTIFRFESRRFVHGEIKGGYLFDIVRSSACYSISDDTRMFFQMSPRFSAWFIFLAGRLVHFHRSPPGWFDLFLVPSLIYRRNKVPFIDYLSLRSESRVIRTMKISVGKKISPPSSSAPLPILFRFLKRPLFVLRMLFILSGTNRFDEIVLSSAICTFYYEGKKKKNESKKENIPLEFLFDRNVYYICTCNSYIRYI